jgi:beta-N-acetylhexosaminidase
MTTQQTIGPVMLDVAGVTLTPTEREMIDHPNTGAVILFARNFQDPEQIAALVQDIRAARNGPLLLAVDQEGGRVQRFQNGFTRLPPAAAYTTTEQAKAAGWLMAAEVLAVGVDFSFAPVLDVDCGISEIIGNRAFGENPQDAIDFAEAFHKGMKAAGMAATGKHFPGHGGVALDSHLTLPIDERDLAALWERDLLPFKHLIAGGLEAIMLAHVFYPNIDPQAAGFSPFWIQQILREELGFKGVVFSDDLSMEGAATVGGFPERARLSQAAGCDMLLVCNNPSAAAEVLDTLPITIDPIRTQRLLRMQGKFILNREQLRATDRWQKAIALLEQI